MKCENSLELIKSESCIAEFGELGNEVNGHRCSCPHHGHESLHTENLKNRDGDGHGHGHEHELFEKPWRGRGHGHAIQPVHRTLLHRIRTFILQNFEAL